MKNNVLVEFLIKLKKPLGLGFDIKMIDESAYEKLKHEKKRLIYIILR